MVVFHLAIAALLAWIGEGQEDTLAKSQDISSTFNQPREEIKNLQDYGDDEYADVIVKFIGSKGRKKAQGLSKNGAKHINDRFKTAAVTVKGSDILNLLDDPDIESVEVDHMRYALKSYPDVDYEFTPWGIQGNYGVNLEGLPPPEDAGWKPIVCVVDTGYASGNQDLPKPSGGFNSCGEGRWDFDLNGHGSHCVSFITDSSFFQIAKFTTHGITVPTNLD